MMSDPSISGGAKAETPSERPRLLPLLLAVAVVFVTPALAFILLKCHAPSGDRFHLIPRSWVLAWSVQVGLILAMVLVRIGLPSYARPQIKDHLVHSAIAAAAQFVLVLLTAGICYVWGANEHGRYAGIVPLLLFWLLGSGLTLFVLLWVLTRAILMVHRSARILREA